jgi:thiamine-monophosphate kinase
MISAHLSTQSRRRRCFVSGSVAVTFEEFSFGLCLRSPVSESYGMVLLTGEFALIEEIRARLPQTTDSGEIWIGDDAAVVRPPEGWMLLAADSVVAGVHADLSLTSLADLGWRAMAACVSDVAAMGGWVDHALVTVAAPEGTDIGRLYDGVAEAVAAYQCPVVGGDLTNAGSLVVTVAVTGHCDGPPVTRSGARPGDVIWVTGPLGAAAAGLRLFRTGGSTDSALLRAHARPHARLREGRAARAGGATAMIDVSDGLAADVGHIGDMSGVGIRLEAVPVAAGATLDDALHGGDDLALVFCAPDSAPILTAFRGLDTPVAIGRCTDNPGERSLDGRQFRVSGWEHRW